MNRDILLPEQQVDCRAMGHVIQFVDIRVPRRRHSCRGACREPKVGMARRRLTKVDGAGMSNRSRIACNSTFKSKRRHAVPAARPLGKPPRFVVARSANPICRHIWNSICGIAAMLTNRVFAHKSPGTPKLKYPLAHSEGFLIYYTQFSQEKGRDTGEYIPSRRDR